MAKIKRFRLKNGRPTNEDFERYRFRSGGLIINKDIKTFVFYEPQSLDYNISFSIGFEEDISKFNDYDNVMVIDENFIQPYGPFYAHYDKEVGDEFPFLKKVIEEYNSWMERFDFLEECTE